MLIIHKNSLKHGLTEDEVKIICRQISKYILRKGTDDIYACLSVYKNRVYEVLITGNFIDGYLVFHCNIATKKFIKEVEEKHHER